MFDVLTEREAATLDGMLQEAYSVSRHVGQRATTMARESVTIPGWKVHNDRANDMAYIRSELNQIRAELQRVLV